MSTPINPNQPQGDSAPASRDAAPAQASAPFGLPPENRAAMPQGAVPAVPGQPHQLDTGAPTQARLPQPLGEDGKSTPIGFGRLFTVELRKMLDTRAGKWLIGAIVGLILIATAFVMFGGDSSEPPQYQNFVAAAGIPLGFLLPILGIMAVTSEWSQRTGLVTFTLEPRRTRVGIAKWAAALLLGAASVIFAMGVGALFTFVAQMIRGVDADWGISGWLLAGTALAQLLGVSQGIAFGLLIQNTPGAICSYLFIPMLVTIITSVDALKDVGKWIDPNQANSPIMQGEANGSDWSHFVVAQVLWLVIPMVLGFIRLNRREVKSS